MTLPGCSRVVRAWTLRLLRQKAKLLVLVIFVLFLSGIVSTLNQDAERFTGPPRLESTCTNCSHHGSTAQDSAFPYGYTINRPRACDVVSLLYLIAVHSEPRNLVDRQLIRADVGSASHRNFTTRLIFFMGLPANGEYPMDRIHEEAAYGDIVLGNFSGALGNATMVSIMILKWTDTFCSNAQFIVRLSDSGRTSARALRSMYEFLRTYSRVFDLFGSVVNLDGQPCEVLSNGELRYCPGPGYLTGCVYIMTGRAVRPLYEAVVRNPVVPVVPELYVTYLLAESAGARRADILRVRGCYLERIPLTRGIVRWFRMKLGIQ
ncbi:lactosylceramide 1,3-N-acetyl-beta-D-glucosaminyltransferase-like [Ornithodoros turicata]|uniref:lactosylceramide 1,3-N-acetyl-beta-D-glucosaminyltransferase-like n=1 Tax=Ornithodoros turicata TaxID=34597 RepID=UPI00313A1ECF